MTRQLTKILGLLLAAVAAVVVAHAQVGDECVAGTPGRPIGTIRVEVEETRVPEGGECVIFYTFYAQYNTRVFNPYFTRLIDLPGRIVISNSDGVVIADAIMFCMGSQRMANCDDWVNVRYGGHIGARIAFRLEACLGPGKRLGPGRYQVQLVLNQSYFAPSPRACGGTFDGKPSEQFDRSPLCASNVVDIEVIPAPH